jgi:hypothetical protein
MLHHPSRIHERQASHSEPGNKLGKSCYLRTAAKLRGLQLVHTTNCHSGKLFFIPDLVRRWKKDREIL